jgi:hypothetical protein
LNLSPQGGISASTNALCTCCRADSFALLPVTQPPQLKPIIANAAVPPTAQGGLDGWMGFRRISSFDAITGLQFRRLPWHEQVRKVLICLSLAGTQNPQRHGLGAQAAAIAVRIRAGRDLEPVFFMIAARWLSTVRWLMPRSAAMFLLGCPASTRSKIWR